MNKFLLLVASKIFHLCFTIGEAPKKGPENGPKKLFIIKEDLLFFYCAKNRHQRLT